MTYIQPESLACLLLVNMKKYILLELKFYKKEQLIVNQLKNKLEILKLKFQKHSILIYWVLLHTEICMQALNYFGYQDKMPNQEFQYAHKVCIYLSKMILYDYEFIKLIPYSLLAASVLYIVFKIVQEINNNFQAEQNIKQIINLLKIECKDLVNVSTRILNLAKNFEQFYPEYTNLKKFNGFQYKQNDKVQEKDQKN
ncbi:n-terminal domain protein [Ichthyophthirius multifiliis]|uniref:N-terminal domain protein n=1 Tax=Ichthyophthirius multifiliis TaxID=5932 RepID=G0R2H3_ICHMU|nr:n-terminal domain protein [Ichthyophthirius multifiliis]EGR28341.1 n-terminal domain protein [Ichthyophthirius multifiliis]|eukprot:XP_004027686.1 n-terminal domain protein [Ichthyophthirius multifiliis]